MRLGKIVVTETRGCRKKFLKYLGDILRIIEFVPVRCEFMFYNNSFEYMGYSPKFEDVPGGQISPEYTLSITTDERGDVTDVTVDKV